MVDVVVDKVSKKYGKSYVLKEINLRANNGELVCILGPSGSGKSTLLKIIAGLINPDEGKVYFDNTDVTNLPAWKRNVGLVFQNIALFPHISVFENIAFGLKLRKAPRDEIDKKVRELLKLIKLEGYERRKPSELSGGEAQRVSIARALAIDPSVLLFDEPLGHLDAKLREELKFEIRRIVKETGKTTLYVTHDQSEAFAIADYIYVINKGIIEQGGKPIELYENPKSPFVAEFIGSTNFLRAKVIEVNFEENIIKVSVDNLIIRAHARPDLKINEEVLIGIRPEDVKLNRSIENIKEKQSINLVLGKIAKKIFVGPYLRIEVDIGLNEPIKADIYGDEKYQFLNADIGSEVYVTFNKLTVFKAK